MTFISIPWRRNKDMAFGPIELNGPQADPSLTKEELAEADAIELRLQKSMREPWPFNTPKPPSSFITIGGGAEVRNERVREEVLRRFRGAGWPVAKYRMHLMGHESFYWEWHFSTETK
jgi:hypothetical protein